MQVLPGKKKTGFGQGLTTLPAVWCWSWCEVVKQLKVCRSYIRRAWHAVTWESHSKPKKVLVSFMRSCLVGCAHKEEITTGMDAWRLPQTEYTTPGNGLAQQRENDSKRNPGKKWKNINTRETDESKHKQKRERQRSWKATIGYIQNWSNRSRYYHLLPTVAVAMAARRHLGSGKRRYTCGELLYNRQQHEVWRQV